ncbi:MAG: heparan-alpha-glucosaminide N-acetyltransferase domain-containing protein [Candidatus Micrarchaeota archaeon]
MRSRGIDVFRGFSIALMIFFSVIARLSGALPDILDHNVSGSMHIGDFVLTLFIFASGMSLVFFERKKRSGSGYLLDVLERTGKLLMVWLFISPFSSGRFLGMDELALIAVLALPTLLLLRFSDRVIAFAAIAPVFLYIILVMTAPISFSSGYLGGFIAVPFYLPVMLCGALVGRKLMEGADALSAAMPVLTGASLTALILLAFIPPYKMDASPTFMGASIVVSGWLFIFVSGFGEPHMERMGRDPMRYWVLMFILFLIPLAFYGFGYAGGLPLGLGWVEATLISLLCIPIVYLISDGVDKAVLIARDVRR